MLVASVKCCKEKAGDDFRRGRSLLQYAKRPQVALSLAGKDARQSRLACDPSGRFGVDKGEKGLCRTSGCLGVGCDSLTAAKGPSKLSALRAFT